MGMVVGGPAEGDGDLGYRYRVSDGAQGCGNGGSSGGEGGKTVMEVLGSEQGDVRDAELLRCCCNR